MSGGSYNYVCHADAATLLESGDARDNLKHMANRLEDFGDDAKAARALTLEIHQEIEALEIELSRKLEQLNRKKEAVSQVWRAVEWCDSNDSTEKDVRESIVAFNEQAAKA